MRLREHKKIKSVNFFMALQGMSIGENICFHPNVIQKGEFFFLIIFELVLKKRTEVLNAIVQKIKFFSMCLSKKHVHKIRK